MRNISPEIFCDEWFGSLDHTKRELWMGLILACADDQGRMINNPSLIRIKIFPYDETITSEFINTTIQEFIKAHKLLSYRFGENGSEKECIQISKWWEYQKAASWAAPSKHPAPEGWTDRIRSHRTGSGTKPVSENWDTPGGMFTNNISTTKPLPSDNVATTKPLNSREDEDEDEVEDEEKDERKPSIPVLTKGPEKKKLVGLVGFDKAIQDLTDRQKENARIAQRIFASSKMQGKKLIDTSVEVATRSSYRDIATNILAAFASVFDDPAVKNKPMVAAYRILHDAIPAQYFKADHWRAIPHEILLAAGRSDLNALTAQSKVNAFLERK